MPTDQPKRPIVVVALWGLIVAVAVGGMVLSALALVYWERFIAFSNVWGNVVSVAGVWIGLIAFLLTIFSLAITHQAEKEARHRIQQTLANAADAVKKAQEETREAIAEASRSVASAQIQMREAIARIGFELLQSECVSLGFAVREINRLVVEAAAHGEYWVRVAERCREAAHAANFLFANPHLSEDEIAGLRRGMDNLSDIARFIEKNRIPPGSVQSPLRAAHILSLEAALPINSSK